MKIYEYVKNIKCSSIYRIVFRPLYDTMSHMCAIAISEPLPCGFRKCYSTQHPLLKLIEDLKKCLDKNDMAGAVLEDPSAAFDG